MELSAIGHRPDSEDAYLYTPDRAHIRLRTRAKDCQSVNLRYSDPYDDLKSQAPSSLPMERLYQTERYDYWQVELGAKRKRLQYLFELIGAEGEHILYSEIGPSSYQASVLEDGWNYFKIPYFHQVETAYVPDWAKETVWYQIFPERFAKGDPDLDPPQVKTWNSDQDPQVHDFFGGDLQGVIDRLDYLEDLGITGLYFCPIFESESNHKYDTIDYYHIDRHFGDEATFRTLVKEAKARGMRIMLDAVFNHIGSHSAQFQSACQEGEVSPYYDWFYFNEDPDYPYDRFADAETMPKLRTDHPEVQDYLLGIAKYWIQEFQIDAWRLDVANEVDHAFWRRLRRELSVIDPEVYLLGEIWHTAQSWLEGDQFHGVMNYALTDPIIKAVVKGEATLAQLQTSLVNQLMKYRRQTNQGMLNLLDSHDTPRLATLAQGDLNKVQAALALMFFLPGAPCLYYGTEIGLPGEHDPGCRRPMNWNFDEEETAMHAFVRQLIHDRQAYQAIIQSEDPHFSYEDGAWFRLTYSKFSVTVNLDQAQPIYVLSS